MSSHSSHFIVVLALLFLGIGGILFVNQRFSNKNNVIQEQIIFSDEEQNQIRNVVSDFENSMKDDVRQERLDSSLAFFVADNRESDKTYREKFLAELAGKSYSFKIISYKMILPSESINGVVTVLVEETRDYEQKSNYGVKFSRQIRLKNIDGWKIEAYKNMSSGNIYSGSLSGSEKYSGFYP
jgi:hypothetical protein